MRNKATLKDIHNTWCEIWRFESVVINNYQSNHKQAITLSRVTFLLSFFVCFITYKANKEPFSSKNTALVLMVSWQVERYYAYICCHKFLVNARYNHLYIKTNTKRKYIRNWGANSLSIPMSICTRHALKIPLKALKKGLIFIGLSDYFRNFTISVRSSLLVIDLERRRCFTKRNV